MKQKQKRNKKEEQKSWVLVEHKAVKCQSPVLDGGRYPAFSALNRQLVLLKRNPQQFHHVEQNLLKTDTNSPI